MSRPPPRYWHQRPWGKLSALLAVCLITLIGFVRGLAPDVILWRSMVGALLCGLATAVACSVAKLLVPPGGRA